MKRSETMAIVFYDKLSKKGFWGIQDPTNERFKGTNIGWIKKKRAMNTARKSVFLVSFKYHRFPHPTGNQIIKKGSMVNCLKFNTLADAKAFAINQLNGGK